MNLAPASTPPRAARRTSCLGTFLLVMVLWSFSVVALAAYLVTRSAIVRQVRVAWWTVFLAAAALLAAEVAVFEAPATASRTCCASTSTPGGCSSTATESARCSPGRYWCSPARLPSAYRWA
jgi:Tfp pilus assembly protein PilX